LAGDVDVELADGWLDMGGAHVEPAVRSGDRTSRWHVDRARFERDLDVGSEEGDRAATVAHGRDAAGDVEARALDLEVARDLVVTQRGAAAEAPGRHVQLDPAAGEPAAEDVGGHPALRRGRGEPRPELLGVADGHGASVDAQAQRRGLA